MTNFVFTSFHSQISLGAAVQWPAGSQPGQGTPSPWWYLISVSREAGNSRAFLSLARSCLSWLSRVWQLPLCPPLQGRLTQPELDSSPVCLNTVKSSTCEQDTRVGTQGPQIPLRVFTLKFPNTSEQLDWYFAWGRLTPTYENRVKGKGLTPRLMRGFVQPTDWNGWQWLLTNCSLVINCFVSMLKYLR